MFAGLKSMGLRGIDGFMVEVEADLSQGLPGFDVVGLPDTAVRESRDRVRAAMKNAGFTYPVSRITVNLAPADVKKEGSVYDLPLLLALLCASGQLKADLRRAAFVGELSLQGTVRPVRGVLPMVIAARDAGIEDVYVWDCELFGYGINIKTTRDRGAYIRGVHARDSLVTSVMVRTKVNYNNDGESAGCLTKISDLTFENLTVTGVYGGTVEKPRRMTPLNFDGFDEPEGALEGVRLKNVRVLASDLGEPLPNQFHNVKDLVIEP